MENCPRCCAVLVVESDEDMDVDIKYCPDCGWETTTNGATTDHMNMDDVEDLLGGY
jgi:Zn-finger nucleic acid-binding protein